jgi:hypothetical protein
VAGSPEYPTRSHGRLPDSRPPRRLPCLHKDPQRHLPNTRYRPPFQAPRDRSQSNPTSQRGGMETTRFKSEAPVPTYFLPTARDGTLSKHTPEHRRRTRLLRLRNLRPRNERPLRTILIRGPERSRSIRPVPLLRYARMPRVYPRRAGRRSQRSAVSRPMS